MEKKKTKIHANKRSDLRPIKNGEQVVYYGGGFHIQKKDVKKK